MENSISSRSDQPSSPLDSGDSRQPSRNAAQVTPTVRCPLFLFSDHTEDIDTSRLSFSSSWKNKGWGKSENALSHDYPLLIRTGRCDLTAADSGGARLVMMNSLRNYTSENISSALVTFFESEVNCSGTRDVEKSMATRIKPNITVQSPSLPQQVNLLYGCVHLKKMREEIVKRAFVHHLARPALLCLAFCFLRNVLSATP